MNENQHKISQHHTNLHKSSTITKSCQNLLCLTSRCYQDQKKQKQKALNSQYFEKLSLKKFNQNSIILNQSICDRDQKYKGQKFNKIDQPFQNINLSLKNKNYYLEGNKYSLAGQNIQQNLTIHCLNQSRIQRTSSQRILSKPQQITDRSIQQELEFEFKRIQDLEKLRKTLQEQIKTLDKSIDKYYSIYNQKINELKKIQFKMIEMEKQKELETKPSQEQKFFKKKPYVQNSTEQGYFSKGNYLNLNQNYRKLKK